MADDLFTEYVRVYRRRLVRLTEENRLEVAQAVGATVHFKKDSAPIVSIAGYHKEPGQWLDENGSGHGDDGETPDGYIPALNAASVAQLLIDHDADRMECADHDGACCPTCAAHGFEHAHLHQAEVMLAALLGVPMPTPKENND